MRRREFVASIGVAIAASPSALAQRGSKQLRIAFVHSGIPAADLTESAGPFWVRRFLQELRRLGYVEGENRGRAALFGRGPSRTLCCARARGRDQRAGLDRHELQRTRPCVPSCDIDNSAYRARCGPGPNRTCREPCAPGR